MNIRNKFLDIVPKYIISILQRLENSGFDAYIVGGAVRDILMGNVPKEYDLASNALPDQISSLFPNTTNIGKIFGTIIIHFGAHAVEITTFRKEKSYSDSRHPDHIEFSESIIEDLPRRDFTINAMAYSPIHSKFLDPFNGQLDLNKRQLQCVGDPMLRFKEDTLRPFRAFRFISQFGLAIDDGVDLALKELVGQVSLPSIERIRSEMDILLMGTYWMTALTYMSESGWLSRLILNTPPLDHCPQFAQSLDSRWAWLLSFSDIQQVAKDLNFSIKDIKRMEAYIQWGYDDKKVMMTTSDLNISSAQLMDLGYSGVSLGKIQKELLDQVRLSNIDNSYDALIRYLQP